MLSMSYNFVYPENLKTGDEFLQIHCKLFPQFQSGGSAQVQKSIISLAELY